MNLGLQPHQIVYIACILVLFTTYGSLVRRGTLHGTAILWAGIPLGCVAIAASLIDGLPGLRAGLPAWMLLINSSVMAFLTLFCVGFSYRKQIVKDVSTYLLGDTKIILRVCPPTQIPSVDALLLPTDTALRMADGPAFQLRGPVGRAVIAALKTNGSVGVGKVVATGGGDLSVGKIFHVAVGDFMRPVDAARLRKGIETGMQQARKAHAESIAVPLGPLRGLPIALVTEEVLAAVLRQRKAFAEIVLILLDERFTASTQKIVENAIRAQETGVVPASVESSAQSGSPM